MSTFNIVAASIFDGMNEGNVYFYLICGVSLIIAGFFLKD